MKNNIEANPNIIHPISGYENEIYIKPTITNPNIVVGDFHILLIANLKVTLQISIPGARTN